MADRIHILGAGLAGMIAAINLAREGREVLVIDAARKIGGADGYHPSVHTTPIDPGSVSAEIGIDIAPAFYPLTSYHWGINDNTYELNPGPNHAVERGPRKTAIDWMLYKKALDAGVQFFFDTHIEDIRELPRGSIVATGLHPGMYVSLEIPSETRCGYAAVCKTPRAPWCGGISSSYTDGYFYANCVNNLMYALLFGRRQISKDALKACNEDAARRYGLKFPHWKYFEVRVPTAVANNPRLFQSGYILSGTVSGTVDPDNLFGIHGAVLSGKIAAIAVSSPARASKAFKHLNRFYKKAYYSNRLRSRLPRRFACVMMDRMIKYPRLFQSVLASRASGIPGYENRGFYREMWQGAQLIDDPPAPSDFSS